MWSTITNIFVGLVGLTVLVVYWLTKRGERRDAANILMMDIVRAEEVVLLVREKNMLDKAQKTILTENNWMKYRHLFISKLSYLEVVAFNRFFDACIAIDEAKKRMDTIFDAGLVAKATIVQEKIFSIQDLSTPEGQSEKQRYITQVDQETHMFIPLEPREIMIRNINSMGNLANTPAFEKLQKIGARRNILRKS